MNILRKLKSKAAIISTAKQYEREPSDVRTDMQEAIALAWSSNDPTAKALQSKLFPNGQPSPQEFIATISEYIKSQRE